MRKTGYLIFIAVIIALMLSFGTSFASDISGSTTISVSATVEPYASVKSSGSLKFNPFTGKANESKWRWYSLFRRFKVETNTDVNLCFSGADLRNGESTIETSYKVGYFTGCWPPIKEGKFSEDNDLEGITQSGCSKKWYFLKGSARLGAISDQQAGDYSAKITLTVSQAP